MTSDPGSDKLHSVVLKLSPTEEVFIRATVGHQAHAAFLSTLREIDPILASALHTPNIPLRPFTVSPLHGVSRPRDGRVHLSPAREYWLRFTILHPIIHDRFMLHFMREVRPTIRLGQAELLVREVLNMPNSHPWSGYTTWGELISTAEPLPEVTLSFVTPTAFSFGDKPWGRMTVVLPIPALVFNNLARAWNALAPPDFHVDREALRAYLEDNAIVKRVHWLKTMMLQFHKSPQVGFVGRVTFGLMGDDDRVKSQINALADFAFYAGVGMKTSMGMGQCRRVIDGRIGVSSRG